MQSMLDRFWAKVQKTPKCWNWIGANDGRYGQFYVFGFTVKAHRFAYENFVGPIQPGFRVLHDCDNGLCVRPDHLFQGTQSDNLLDAVAKGRHRSGRSFGRSNGTHTKPESVRRGAAANAAKLTEDQVKEIRRLHQDGLNYERLSERFGVRPGTISQIIRRKAWTHV